MKIWARLGITMDISDEQQDRYEHKRQIFRKLFNVSHKYHSP